MPNETKRDGYTIINVQVQPDFEQWKEKEMERQDGTTYKVKVEPAGLRNKSFTVKDKEGVEHSYRSVCVPSGVKVNGVKIGGSHYTIPESAIHDIEPNHEKAAEWEKNADPAKVKKIILSKDYNLKFTYKNYDSKQKQNVYVQRAEATAYDYKKALDENYKHKTQKKSIEDKVSEAQDKSKELKSNEQTASKKQEQTI